jgi:hypothetical protein
VIRQSHSRCAIFKRGNAYNNSDSEKCGFLDFYIIYTNVYIRMYVYIHMYIHVLMRPCAY